MNELPRTIPMNVQDKIEREMQPGERIKWMDQPAAHFFSPGMIGVFLFSLVWAGFAFFWESTVIWQLYRHHWKGELWIFVLFGIPFVLIGLGMLTSPYWYHQKILRTVYVITNRRAIIMFVGRTVSVESFMPAQLGDLVRREKPDGSGDIAFTRGLPTNMPNMPNTRAQERGFFHIRDVKTVDAMLQELARQPVAAKSNAEIEIGSM